MLAVWSAGPDSLYVGRLRKAGFKIEVKTVRKRRIRVRDIPPFWHGKRLSEEKERMEAH